MKRRYFPLSAIILLAGCAPLTDGVGDTQDNCPATHPRLGQSAVLTTRFHGVRGTARIVDDCTIVIENFAYDGGGLDVRVYAGDAAGSFAGGRALSNDLRRAGGYANETLTVKLPVGVTLDDVGSLSIWCVPASMSFGDGVFQ